MKKLVTLVLAVIVTLTLSACSGATVEAASTIAIDVNPSIVLELDEDDTVINVILNNEDAEVIIGDMDLVGVDYNVAVNALIGSMVANGYINELSNSILISVQSNDEAHESDLMVLLSQAINDYLQGSSIEGSVITQSLDLDQDAEELAESLGISEAKAELILDIIELDPRMTLEELALLSINDLNLLLETKNYALDNVNKTGSASALGLITVEEAYQAALLALDIDEASVLKLEIDLEQEDGIMVYEIEIETDTNKYELYIDAKEGTVYVEVDDDDDDDEDDDEVFPADALSETEVLEMVATSLGLDQTLITEIEFDQEMDNGVAFYEVEFKYEGTEYELDVDALTGEIYSNSMDEDGYDYDDDYDDEDEEDIEDESDDEMDDEDESDDELDNEDESDDEIDNEDESDDELDDEDESDDEMDNEDGSDDTDTTTDPTTDPTVDLPIFTLDELATYTGADGSLAYIAVDGIVYDATSIFNNGQHQGLQIGGTDATTLFESSPHSASLLETLEIVGTLE